MNEWSIVFKDGELALQLGEFRISGVPCLEVANSFIELFHALGYTCEECLNDNLTVSLVGGFIITDVLERLKNV